MHIDGKSRRATGIALLILLTSFSHPLWSQAGDESGTLVMVARTTNAVIVSVDSKVTPNDSTASSTAIPATPVSGDRKLVNVGERSACAIDGNLGANEGDKDVSASLRLWIAKNPNTEAQEAIDALLDAAVGAWDRNHFTLDQIAKQGDGGRKIGSRIAKITCGEFVKGRGRVSSTQNGPWFAVRRALSSDPCEQSDHCAASPQRRHAVVSGHRHCGDRR
jgi:hypothetical protein